MSSPCSSPLLNHHKHQLNGHMHRHHRKDGYSSLERLNRRPRVNKCSLEKLFLRRASLETMRSTLGNGEMSSSGVTRNCSGDSSGDEVDVEGLLHNTEFIRNRKERSTVLVRRFFKNNQKVSTCNIPFLALYAICILDMFVIFSVCFLSSLLTVFIIYSVLRNNETC